MADVGRAKKNKPRSRPTAGKAIFSEVIPGSDLEPFFRRMFTDYCYERMLRGELPWGMPADSARVPMVMSDGRQIVGFMSIDVFRRSVELVYVREECRRRGHGVAMLRKARQMLGSDAIAKGPFSPEGMGLVSAAGLTEAPRSPEARAEQVQADEEWAEHMRTLLDTPCGPHGSTGGCPECMWMYAVRLADKTLAEGSEGYARTIALAKED